MGVESAGLGHGCSFTVRMPLMQEPAACQSLSADQGAVGRLRGVRLLLVDDSPDVLEALGMLLEIEEADAQCFSNPLEAIEAARHSSFDIIVSDIGMSGMDGYALLAALRELPHLERTPSIALSGYGAQPEGHAASSLGFALFLQKPVPMERFVEALKGLV